MYLTCSHCGCEFLATKTQEKRRAIVSEGARFYCSPICQHAGSGQARRRPEEQLKRYVGVCATCSKTFQSVYPGRKFCTLRCYMGNQEVLARLRVQAIKANAAAVLKNTGREVKPRVEIACLNCGVKQTRKPSQLTKKYCNARCYREYMAKRFDRWIAAPQTIALPQGYDEFLTQNELPCLIEGCDWVGLNLGNHVNFTHGIPANEFKRAAGFNLHTGLCTPAVSEILASRPHLYDGTVFGGAVGSRGVGPPSGVRNYPSLEGHEHRVKAYALLNASAPIRPIRICAACGKEFQPTNMGHGKKFCTIPCRDQWYKKNLRAYKVWMTCAQCCKDFQGSRNQELNRDRGHQVFCTFRCRSNWVWQHSDTMRHRRPPTKRSRDSELGAK